MDAECQLLLRYVWLDKGRTVIIVDNKGVITVVVTPFIMRFYDAYTNGNIHYEQMSYTQYLQW